MELGGYAMKLTEEAIGGRLIEAITDGLYDGNINCLREYIQNALDANPSIISVDLNNKNVCIFDDGEGMNEEDLARALKIGVSNKGDDYIGWRGIGIWSGVSACKNIIITTKKKSNNKLKITIDCEHIRRHRLSNKPALHILNEALSEVEIEESEDDEEFRNNHFTKITLKSILPTQYQFYEKEKVEEYIRRNIPLPFDCDNFTHGLEITKYLEKYNIIYPSFDLLLNNIKLTRPPLDNDDDYHDRVIYHEFKIGDEVIAIAWLLPTRSNRQLKNKNDGIFFKKKGFQIGTQETVYGLYTGTYHKWVYGEIHIIDSDIKENTARNAFEYNVDNDKVQQLLDQVREFLRRIEQFNHEKQVCNSIEKDMMKINECIISGDKEKAKKILKNIKKEKMKEKKPLKDDSFKPVLKDFREKRENVLNKLTDIEKQINKKIPTREEQAKKDYNEHLKSLPPELRNSIRKTSMMNPTSHWMEPIIKKLQEKIGDDSIGEMKDLTKKAYGFNGIHYTSEAPILSFLKEYKRKDDIRRNASVGGLIYILYDLFINCDKHNRVDWYDGLSNPDQIRTSQWIQSTMALIYRIIEDSQDYQTIKRKGSSKK